MTSEPPSPDQRRARPGARARRTVLGLPEDPATESADVPAAVPAVRESLRESLARIPDLDGDEASEPEPTSAPDAPEAPDVPDALDAPDAPEVDPGPATSPKTTPAALAADDAVAPVPLAAGPGHPPLWRRIMFALVVVSLVAAIPVLGYAGYQVIAESEDGATASTSSDPADPGYEAQVDPTPTAVVIQYGTDGLPMGTTFLSLSSTEGGGGIVFVPLDTEVAKPSFGVVRLRGSYTVMREHPMRARDQLASEVGKLLNVGIQEVIELDDAGWAAAVEPVAPLKIDSPESVDIGNAVVIPSGPTELQADQVGPYLRAQKWGESGRDRLARSQVVWEAWLAQIKAADRADAVPGETNSGLGKFARRLSAGPVTSQILPVERIADGTGRYRIKKPEVNDLVTDLVPSPLPAYPGSRFTVRLLDGVSAGSVPLDITRQIVHLGGSVSVIGNGPAFGQEKTTVVYANPARKALAGLVLKALGGTGKARLDPEAPDTVDLTVLLGSDILGDTAATTTPSTTTTTVAGSGTVPVLTQTSGGT